jgi:hypothetical protein
MSEPGQRAQVQERPRAALTLSTFGNMERSRFRFELFRVVLNKRIEIFEM